MPLFGQRSGSQPPRPRATAADWTLVVVAVLTFGLAGLVAYRQTEILDNQAALMQVQYLPMLQMKLDPAPDPENPGWSREYLTISNSGGIIRSFTAVPVEVIYVESTDGSFPIVRLPFADYYGDRQTMDLALTGNGQGDLGVWKGQTIFCGPDYRPGQYVTRGDWLADQLERHIVEQLGDASFRARTETLVRVSYGDIFGSFHSEIYQLNTLGFGWNSPDVVGASADPSIAGIFTEDQALYVSGVDYDRPDVERWFLSYDSAVTDVYDLWQQEWASRGLEISPVPASPASSSQYAASPSPTTGYASDYWKPCN